MLSAAFRAMSEAVCAASTPERGIIPPDDPRLATLPAAPQQLMLQVRQKDWGSWELRSTGFLFKADVMEASQQLARK